MNKFLTLVFLGLLLIILHFSTQTTHRDAAVRLAVPASYANLPATALPHGSNALANRMSTNSRLLVATQRQQAVP